MSTYVHPINSLHDSRLAFTLHSHSHLSQLHLIPSSLPLTTLPSPLTPFTVLFTPHSHPHSASPPHLCDDKAFVSVPNSDQVLGNVDSCYEEELREEEVGATEHRPLFF